MVWLTQNERLVLTILGTLALAGLGINVWQQQRAPLRVEAGPSPPYAQWEAVIQAAKQVDLNQAAAQDLERLPEIGPSLAQRIIAYRMNHGPFRNPEELLEVPGIGPKTYETVKGYITVR
jgi:competence ComEA-like helix-hairpin-helix protein